MLWAEGGQESPCSVLKEGGKGCFGADGYLLERWVVTAEGFSVAGACTGVSGV